MAIHTISAEFIRASSRRGAAEYLTDIASSLRGLATESFRESYREETNEQWNYALDLIRDWLETAEELGKS